MRDWSRAFRRASFRGVRFWVDQDAPEFGRRVAVHEISGGDRPVVEDMGKRATAFSVDAYVASDLADIEGLALEAACRAQGASLLVLPMDPAQSVMCLDCRRSREKDENGYIGYDLTFIEAGAAAVVPVGGIGALREVFAAGVGAAAAALSGAF